MANTRYRYTAYDSNGIAIRHGAKGCTVVKWAKDNGAVKVVKRLRDYPYTPINTVWRR